MIISSSTRVWRICKKIYIDKSLSGEGGLKSAGRWHHKGHRIVYTSQSLALASLELWMHVAPQSPLPSYVSVCAEIPDGLQIHDIEEKTLPPGWRAADPKSTILKEIGTAWLLSQSSVIARVPSAVISGEFNYLLNPLHPHFEQIQPGNPDPFGFDPRMWKFIRLPNEGAER